MEDGIVSKEMPVFFNSSFLRGEADAKMYLMANTSPFMCLEISILKKRGAVNRSGGVFGSFWTNISLASLFRV